MLIGINIDHIATLRNTRKGNTPDLLRAVKVIASTGCDFVTLHLREDRRHITDNDLYHIKKSGLMPINLEIAPTREMVDIALSIRPYKVCFVPEKREELTTESGLDILANRSNLLNFVKDLNLAKIYTNCFIDPSPKYMDTIKEIGFHGVEIHTGELLDLHSSVDNVLSNIKDTAEEAKYFNLNCAAGHGLNYNLLEKIKHIPNIDEVNIGHFVITESLFDGLETVITRIKKIFCK